MYCCFLASQHNVFHCKQQLREPSNFPKVGLKEPCNTFQSIVWVTSFKELITSRITTCKNFHVCEVLAELHQVWGEFYNWAHSLPFCHNKRTGSYTEGCEKGAKAIIMTLFILSSLFECICTSTVTCLRPESLQGYCTTPQHSLRQITCLVEWRARTFRIFLKPNFYFPTACSVIIGWHVHRSLSDWSASFSCYVENVLQGLFSHKTDNDSTCNPKNDPARTQPHYKEYLLRVLAKR